MPTITIQSGEFTEEFDCDDADILDAEILEFIRFHERYDYKIVGSNGFNGIDILKFDKSETRPPDLERICAIAKCLENDHTDCAFVVWYNDQDGESYDSCELESKFTEQFLGKYDSREEWAGQYWEDTGLIRDIPENLQGYIDYGAYARDCRLGGDVSFVDIPGSSGVYVFRNY